MAVDFAVDCASGLVAGYRLAKVIVPDAENGAHHFCGGSAGRERLGKAICIGDTLNRGFSPSQTIWLSSQWDPGELR